jgi:HEAT repeats/Putative zinc-finger
MKCEDVLRAIPLYLYGEVSPVEEELLEDHVAGCTACAQEFKLQKAVHAALDSREMIVPAGLLQECRGDLTRRVARQPEYQRTVGHGVGEWFRDLLQHGIPLRVPVSAMALIAVGYLAARLTGPLAVGNGSLSAANASLENSPFSSAIRSIESQSSGTVRIALDEIHRREVTGRLDDEKIQGLLLAGLREENNPGVRVESVGMLRECVQSSPVRAALLDRVLHDPNAGVRLKALEGLKAFAGEASVRQTLAQVLLHDDNPGVRIETIDVLTSHRDDAMVGILQDVFQKEDNHYVRTRVQNALQEMHATVGTF